LQQEAIMRTFLTAVFVGLVVASVARAGLPQAGTKNIPVEHRIETDKEYPDWVFFVVRGTGDVTKVPLAAKTPIVIPGSSAVDRDPLPRPGEKEKGLAVPRRASALVAVPKDKANEYKTEKELHAAITEGRITGVVVVGSLFFDHEGAKAADPRKSIVQRYRLAQLNAREGAKLEPIKPDEPKK